MITSIKIPSVKGDHFLNPLRLDFIALNLLSDHSFRVPKVVTKTGFPKSHIFNRRTEVQITNFQTSDKTSSTIKYLLGILKIHQTSCLGSWVQTSPTCLPAEMYYGNFGMHKCSFWETNTYCLNKPCNIFFYFFFIPSTAKSVVKHMQWRIH